MGVMLETPSELYLRKNFLISAGMMEGLNRINQAGAERARQALVGYLRQDQRVEIDAITILPLTMLAQRLRAGRREYLGCHIRIFGELQAELYCYLEERDARVLLAAVLGQHRVRRPLGNLEQSALAELTNVLANSYWLALHGHVPLNWRTSVPAVVGRIERIFALASRIGHYDFLAFHTDLALTDLGFHLYFCLIPGADCLNRFLSSLEAERLHPLVRD
ncbi:MAG: chemotaxis protein CheC [Bacteroidota bacterium]